MDCLICCEDVIRTGYAVSVRCGHIFHGKCLLKWTETSNSCPVCRIEISKDHVTSLYFSNGLGQDDNYKYSWEYTKPQKEDNTTAQVDTVVVVTTPTDPLDHSDPPVGVCIAMIISCVFAISFFLFFAV